ncbi:MAG: GDP-mannose 4,6-dehydratase [bacterium]|nr:GDP-mannose 4,6-dehydratase [bacterium]
MSADGMVLITGAGGFIGSHLVERCVAMGMRVRAFVRYVGGGSWGWLDDVPCRNELEVVAGDIRDYDAVLRAARGCGAVFHLAALIGIPYSYVSPLAYVRTNVEGTYNVLQAALECGTGEVLVTSTSETYGNVRTVPIGEGQPPDARSPYAATKVAADQLALSYHRSFGLPVKIVRPFNTYGPRQSARAVIPSIIIQLLAGAREIRLGNLAPTRDLTFVRDTVDGFLAAHDAPGFIGEAVHIGMDEEISVGDLARMIARLMGAEARIVLAPARVRPEEGEVERLRADNRRLKAATGWEPRYDLEAGLRETIDWIRENRHRYRPDRYEV